MPRGCGCPPPIFSALVVWPLFRLGTAFGGVRTGTIAALLFTFSNYHYGFAHEVRAYALFTLSGHRQVCGKCGASMKVDVERPCCLALLNIAMVLQPLLRLVDGGPAIPVRAASRVPRGTADRCCLRWVHHCTGYLPYAAVFLTRLGTSVSAWHLAHRPGTGGTLQHDLALEQCTRAGRSALAGDRHRHSCAPRETAPGMALGLMWTFVPLVRACSWSRTTCRCSWTATWSMPHRASVLLSAISLSLCCMKARWRWVPAAAVVAGMAFTFHPWKDHGLHPSRVVAQVQQWQEGHRSVLIAPDFYAPTFAWHLDQELIRDPEALELELMERNVFLVDRSGSLRRLGFR